MKARAPLLVAAFFALAASDARATTAPSFGCNGDTPPTEVATCADDALARADAEMEEAYDRLTTAAPTWAADLIREEQQDWVADRNACGGDAECVMNAYARRLRQLDDWSYQLGI